MKRALFAAAAAFSIAATPPVVDRGGNPNAPIVIQMDAIPTGALITMLLRDVMGVPYVIAPDVLSDRRPTSVNLRIPRNDVPSKVVTFLRKSGFTVDLVGGTVYVGKGSRFGSPDGGFSMPTGSPVDLGSSEMPVSTPRVAYPPVDLRSESMTGGSSVDPRSQSTAPVHVLVYVPAHRDPAYIAAAAAPMFPSVTFGARADVAPSQPDHTVTPENGPDVLVMGGSEDDLARARKLVALLDRPRPMVAVKAVVMQVSDVQSRGSALSVLARLGGGKLQLGSFPATAAGPQFVRVATGALTAMLSAIREDSRVRVVASPNLAALSGEVATMNAGAQVPTVGALTFPEGGGPPVQSVVYRDSGITLTVRPVVRGDLIEMDVKQERSTFTRTTTGVEDSPTLNKTATAASVVMKSGESVILAGLTENSVGHTREGLLGGLLGVRTRDKSDSEIVVMLQAELVPSPPSAPGQFFDVKGNDDDGNPDGATDELAPLPRQARTAV